MKLKYLVPFLGATLSCQAMAAFTGGQELHENLLKRIGGSHDFLAVAAAGYVVGVTDSFNNDMFCIPAGVTQGQLIQVGSNYLTSHPEQWNKNASSLLIVAFVKVWPCPQPKK